MKQNKKKYIDNPLYERVIREHYRRSLFEGDGEEGPEWVISFATGLQEDFDDNYEDDGTHDIKINAPDAETAVKYAEQYARKMRLEDDSWQGAEIVSVNRV